MKRIFFKASTREGDLERISAWIAAEPSHVGIYKPHWWLTGTDCLFAGRIEDEQGPVFYLRVSNPMEHDGGESGLRRVFIQFGPPSEVSKKRIIQTFLRGFHHVCDLCQKRGANGLVFESTSPRLIQFCKKVGFQHERGNDYSFLFNGQN
jgi:hypothetical protein